MGKVDDMRALKEALRAARRAEIIGASSPPSRPEAVVARRRLEREIQQPVAQVALGSEEMCGHMSISKARCTRVKGHPEKNHRYK